MFLGTPCIASDIPPFREISENGEHLYLFEKGNVQDLYSKIVHLTEILHENETGVRIERAKNFISQNFTIKNHLCNLHKLYSECLA
jgi:glycosyltransferase involved in cell wall biosynthesis